MKYNDTAMSTHSFIFLWVLSLLCSLLLSSCVSQQYQKIWHGAHVVEKTWWVEESGRDATPLYRCGDAYYALGKISSAKGCYKRTHIPFEPLQKSYCPRLETAQAAYLRLTPKAALTMRKALAEGTEGVIELADPFCSVVEVHLTQCPRGAVKLPLELKVWNKGKLYAATSNLDDSAHTTPEKYWRYPLSVLTAVAVDAPLMIAGNVAIASVFLITSPITVPIAISEALEKSN